MTDIALDKFFELQLDNNGDIKLVDGNEELLQRVRLALNTWRGEWLFDQRVGVPYFERILGTKLTQQNINRLKAELIEVFSQIPGVLSVNSLTLNFDTTARSLTVAVAITGDSGLTVFNDFIVDLENIEVA